jgi:hypothetical protein
MIRYQVSCYDRRTKQVQQTFGNPEDRSSAETRLKQLEKTFEVFIWNGQFRFDIREIPDAPVPDQPPLAKDCVVTDKFPRDHGLWSVFVNYRCSICDQSHRIALDVLGPGNKIIQCECNEQITIPLEFDVPEVEKPEPQPVQVKADWLRFWNPSS